MPGSEADTLHFGRSEEVGGKFLNAYEFSFVFLVPHASSREGTGNLKYNSPIFSV